jgi:hypothetical protein
MQFYVTFSQHVKNTIVSLHDSPVNVQMRNDGAFLIPVGDSVQAPDYAHLISESDASWFAESFLESVSKALKGIAHIYPRLNF